MAGKSPKSKRVGIVGWWSNLNYGGVITYYALYNAIKDLGYDPLMIRRIASAGAPKDKESIPARFGESHYALSAYYTRRTIGELNDVCGAFVSGSDQLYNPALEKYSGGEYYLDFVSDNNIKFTYASSFGDAESAPKAYLDKYKPLMERLDAVSVRENFAVDIARKLYGVQATQVLDPVFLARKESYEALVAESDEEVKDGLLCFFLDPTPEKRALAERVAAELGVEADFFLDMQRVDANAERLKGLFTHPNCEPQALVKGYARAKYVLTDSFHGTCLSIIFNKQFISIANVKRGPKRFQSLLSTFDLSDRMTFDVSFDAVKGMLAQEIDYERVNAILDRERERSRGWLQDKLAGLGKTHNVALKLPADLCTGCASCANSCPVSAIQMKKDAYGFWKPNVNLTRCVDCGKCVKSCGVLSARFQNREEPPCYAVMASDDLRAVSSSGGAFTLLAEKVLKMGGVVFGAAFTDDFGVRHIAVENVQELAKLRGSKYYASEMGDVYRQVKACLDSGRKVLFSGVPCQISALRAFLGRQRKGLVTVEIVCHGVSSEKVFRKYAKDVFKGKTLTAISFKPKKPWGWHAGVTASFADGSTYAEPVETDLFYRSYLASLNRSSACGTCAFSRFPRQGDITIGDFWGVEKFDPALNDKQGTSLLFLNNETGDEFVKDISFALRREVPLAYATRSNGALVRPFPHHPNRQAFLDRLEKEDFASLTRRMLAEGGGLESVAPKDRPYYFMAAAISQNIGGRKLLLWGDSGPLRRMLQKHFGLAPDGFLTVYENKCNAQTEMLGSVAGKASEVFVAGAATGYDAAVIKRFEEMGFKEGKDFLLRGKTPVTLENLDLSSGGYHDAYGNVIEGYGTLKKVVIEGYNNRVTVGEGARTERITELHLAHNADVRIGEGCKFFGDFSVRIFGSMDGASKVEIGQGSEFRSGSIRLWNHPNGTSVVIGKKCTFEENLSVSGSGRNLVLGDDCMTARNVTFLLGDGYAIYDVESAKCVNSVSSDEARNTARLGAHVWVGLNAIVMAGASVGEGSIIGAGAVVKRKFANNVAIAGNPSAVIRRNAAWAREGFGKDISQCGEYAKMTEEDPAE